MMHHTLRYPAGWEWHLIQEQRDITGSGSESSAPPGLPSRKKKFSVSSPDLPLPELAFSYGPIRRELIAALGKDLEFSGSWIQETLERRHNLVSVSEDGEGRAVLSGTLMIQLSKLYRDVQPLHFWVCGNRLITWHDDLRLPLRLQQLSWAESLQRCATVGEAFAVVLSAALEDFHTGLDEFERRLTQLEDAVHSHNRTALLPVIFERRHDLLHWNHLFLPIREIHDAAKEAFMDELVQSASFQRLSYKLERIDSLLSHYTSEMDTLIAMDDAIASFRGNDIMKTLTIFTALFVPPTIAGTLWGVNFRHLPGVDSKWVFSIMCAVVVVFTAALYFWLWHKGWAGYLLMDRRSLISGSQKKFSRREPGREAADNSPASLPVLSRSADRRSRTAPIKQPGKKSRSLRPYPGADEEEQ